ncbi:unnamed protein product [Arabidopsis lyrata]|nr:unnamed protein product [Arabidopsis lyrata]
MEVGSATKKLQCQRIGCNAMFSDDDNPQGSCQFHASVRLLSPLFNRFFSFFDQVFASFC